MSFKFPTIDGGVSQLVSTGIRALRKPRALRLSEAANGKTYNVKAGRDVRIDLSSNPSTGYQWNVVQTDRTFGYPKERYRSGGPGVGTGGTVQLTWKTNGPMPMLGKHQVTLVYARPWDMQNPAQTVSFTINVVK